jgi:TonB family protein
MRTLLSRPRVVPAAAVAAFAVMVVSSVAVAGAPPGDAPDSLTTEQLRALLRAHAADCDDEYMEFPEPIHRESPVVPPGLSAPELRRIVKVFAIVGEGGRVLHAETREPPTALDAAAIRCVRRWTFRPARHCGHPLPVEVAIPIRFDGQATGDSAEDSLRTAGERPTSGNTIGPFPVPGDTSRDAVERWRTSNRPRRGETTVAPLPPPMPRNGQDALAAPPPGGTMTLWPPGQPLVEPPVPIQQPAPVYPERARRAGLAGDVMLHVQVLHDGRVGRVRVLRSVPGLDEAAIACVRRWRFRPARDAKGRVMSWLAVPFSFRLH